MASTGPSSTTGSKNDVIKISASPEPEIKSQMPLFRLFRLTPQTRLSGMASTGQVHRATESQPREAAAHERNESWAAQDPINHRIQLQRAGKFVLQIPEMYSGDSQNGGG